MALSCWSKLMFPVLVSVVSRSASFSGQSIIIGLGVTISWTESPLLSRTLKYEEVYLKAYANATEARREVGAYFRFYNDQRPHQALGHRTPAEVFHQVTDVGEDGAVQGKKFPIDQTLESLAGAAGLSLYSTSVLSN